MTPDELELTNNGCGCSCACMADAAIPVVMLPPAAETITGCGCRFGAMAGGVRLAVGKFPAGGIVAAGNAA